MSRKLFALACLCLFSTSLLAEQTYAFNHKFILKKDELGHVFINRKEVIKKPTKENPNNEYHLKFRWTLYANQLLTVLANYRGHPTQYIMKKTYPMESVIIPLLPDGENVINTKVYLKMVFNDFNQSSKEAIFDIFIEDKSGRIEVEFKPIKVNKL